MASTTTPIPPMPRIASTWYLPARTSPTLTGASFMVCGEALRQRRGWAERNGFFRWLPIVPHRLHAPGATPVRNQFATASVARAFTSASTPQASAG